MSGSRSWSIVAGVGVAAWIAVACRTPTNAVDPATAAVLADVGPRVLLPAIDDFVAATDTLTAATAAWRASGAEADRQAAQAAWRDAFVAWQVLEPMQLGPAASSVSAVGGLDLRDRIYAWPTIARCKVDQVTAKGEATAAGFVDDALVDVIGLGALETLLFSLPGENACGETVDINADGTWAALGTDGVQAARAAYADVLAADVRASAGALRDAWDPAQGDFSGALAAAGTEGSPYADGSDALDAIFAALMYVDTAVKDEKIGPVLGVIGCDEASCTDDVEAPLADASIAAVQANLHGFDLLFHGGDGEGLDDLLVDHGDTALRDEVDAALADAIAKTAALSIPLEDAASDPATAEAFTAIEALGDLLVGDVATVLTLTLPAEAAGDAD